MLDTQISIETPEGIDLKLAPASMLVRSFAYTIDLLLRTIFTLILIFIITYLPLSSYMKSGFFMISIFLLTWFYPVFFEMLQDGATPGKKVLHLKVVHDNGTPISLNASIVRNFLRVVDALPFFYVLGILSICTNAKFKRLGDLAAGTVVIYRHPKLSRPVILEHKPVQPPVALELNERRAIVSYAERYSLLSKARQKELANKLVVLHHQQDEAAIETLLGMANSLSKTT